MISPDAALRRILSAVRRLPAEPVSLEDADGRVLAEAVRAREDSPAFHNSAVDGYAVRRADLRRARPSAPAALRLRGSVRAGAVPSRRLGPGETMRVMTGAPLPAGADAMVMRERVAEDGGRARFAGPVEAGQHVRRRGSDVRRGDPLLAAGTVLRPWDIAVLASQGFSRVRAVRRPRVAVLSSGDELCDYRRRPAPGGVRDATSPALAAALARWGCLPVAVGRCPDRPAAARRALGRALADADAVLATGGVSVGDHDHTRAVLRSLGLKERFWRVGIRPGKPLLFGTARGKPVFGLPGNPVSTLACAEVFVRPALDRLSGRPHAPAFPARGRLAAAFSKPASLRQYLFCAADRKGRLRVLRPQGSAFLGMASRADALAVGREGLAVLPRGRELEFRWLR